MEHCIADAVSGAEPAEQALLESRPSQISVSKTMARRYPAGLV
jgi:hypothetical protein